MKRRWLGGLTALLLVLTAVFPAGWGGVRAEEAPEALPQTVVSADSRSYDQYRALNADQPAGTRDGDRAAVDGAARREGADHAGKRLERRGRSGAVG